MQIKKERIAWNKGLKGEEYKKHYPNGISNLFKKGHTISYNRKEKQKKIMQLLYHKKNYKGFLKNTGKTRFKQGQKAWNKDKEGYLSGKKHYNWQGGITPLNHKLRQSFKYKKWRDEVFERDNYTCQECGLTNCCIEAHHKKPFSKYINLRFEIDNGITYCTPCHSEIDEARHA